MAMNRLQQVELLAKAGFNVTAKLKEYGPFKGLHDFRKTIASVIRKTMTPAYCKTNEIDLESALEIAHEAGNIDYEGGGVFGVLWNTWMDVEHYASSLKRDGENSELADGGYWDDAAHDMFLEMFLEHSNAWNYEPGHKGIDDRDRASEQDKIDAVCAKEFLIDLKAKHRKLYDEFDRTMKKLKKLYTKHTEFELFEDTITDRAYDRRGVEEGWTKDNCNKVDKMWDAYFAKQEAIVKERIKKEGEEKRKKVIKDLANAFSDECMKRIR
jgi:hypothetical protein